MTDQQFDELAVAVEAYGKSPACQYDEHYQLYRAADNLVTQPRIPVGTLDLVEQFRAMAQFAREAAGGDSNDTEIAALQSAVEIAERLADTLSGPQLSEPPDTV